MIRAPATNPALGATGRNAGCAPAGVMRMALCPVMVLSAKRGPCYAGSRLWGRGADMAIKTGNGSDNEIFGTDSADILSGGGGNDTLSPRGIFLEPPTSTAFDHVYGGDGNADLLILDCRGESTAVTLGIAASPRFVLTSASGNFEVQGAADIERVAIFGGGGDDILNTGAFGAAVAGGGGIDLWIGNYTETTSNVLLHVDTTHVVRAIGLMDFFGIERIDLVTGSGNDNIAGGAYVDNIVTGAGNDILNPGAKPVGAFENVDGGAGIDTFVVDAETETLPVTLGVAGSPNFIVTSVSDRYGASAYNCERVIFRGGAGDDVIGTGSGALQVNGRGGIDLWIADYRTTTADIDYFVSGNQSLIELGITSFGDVERLSLVCGTGNDTIFTGNHADRIDGGAGNDRIDLGACDPASATYDVGIGGAGRDLLIVRAGTETTAVRLASGGLDYAVTSVSNRFRIDAYEFERIDLTSGSGSDSLAGAGNADTLASGAGNDTLLGGGGKDSLDGGRSNDVLTGGAGQDDMTGGAGQDVFDFDVAADSPAAQADMIHDFLSGTDKIDLSGLDANGTLPGEPEFLFIRNQRFHRIAGELRADFGTVQVDFDGDGRADFQINFANGGPAGLGDFIL